MAQEMCDKLNINMFKCKQISDKLMKPIPIVINMLTKFEDIVPKWKIVPTKNIIDSAFKDTTNNL